MSFQAAENTVSKDDPRNSFCDPTWLYEVSTAEIGGQRSFFSILGFW